MNSTAYDNIRSLLALRDRVPWAQWPEELRDALQHAAHAMASRQEIPPFPPQVYIEPTNACDCNCAICPRQNMTRPIGRMASDLFIRIVDEIAALGPSEIHLFNFGEPTLHPALGAMLRACRDRKLSASFQTNGLTVRKESVLEWLEAGLTHIGISVNGLNPAEYETIRPGHSFAALRDNLLRLREIIDTSGHPCQIHVAAQVSKSDLATRRVDIENYKKTWLAVADSLSIFGVSSYDRVFTLTEGQMSETALADRIRKADGEVVCFEPFDRLVVKWDGRATVCCVDFDARMPVGDLKTQSLKEIWTSSRMNNIRAIMRTKTYSRLPLCRTCPKFYSDSFTLFFKKTGPGVRQPTEAAATVAAG